MHFDTKQYEFTGGMVVTGENCRIRRKKTVPAKQCYIPDYTASIHVLRT